MADSTISALPIEATVIEGNDFMVIAKEISLGVWETQKVKVTGLPPSTNIYNADGSLTGDRTVDMDGFALSFENGSVFAFEATSAPSGGGASFSAKGYGTLLADIAFRESSQAGVIRESYGDRSQKNFGDVVMDTYKKIYFNGTLGYIRQSTGSNGVEIMGNGGSHVFGWNSGQYLATGNLDIDSILHYNSNANSYFAQGNGSYVWKFGKTGNNGAIRGNITGSFTNTEIITFDQTDGKTIFNLAGINMPNLPTSPTGLAVGDLWYFGGAVGIV